MSPKEKPVRTVGEPHNRLTRLGNEVLDVLHSLPEYREGDRCVVFLSDGERGGTALDGYSEDAEAMVDVLMHLRAVFEANGKTLAIVPIGRG